MANAPGRHGKQRCKSLKAASKKNPGNRAIGRRKAVIGRELSYRMFMEMSPDAVYISQGGLIIEANQAAADLFRLSSPAQLAGKALSDFAHPDSKVLIAEREKILFSGEAEAPLVEEKLVRPDGSVIYIEVKSRSFRHRGRLLVQSVARDVTARRMAEQELVRFKSQLEYILEATKTGVVVIDRDLEVVYASPYWKRRFGEPSGRKCYGYFGQSPSPCRPCRVLEAIESRAPRVIEERGQADPGRFTQVHIVPFQDEAGGWMAAEFSIDITDLKQVQNELSRRQRELTTLLENIPAGVFFKDAGGRYLLANRNFCEVGGVTQEQLTGRKDEEIFSPEFARRSRENEAKALSSDRPQFFGENEVVQNGQKLTVETRMVPVRDEKGANLGVIGIYYNVTERKAAEEQARISALQWQTTFDAMGDGIALVDTKGAVQRCNLSLGRILGRPCREIVGMKTGDLVPSLNEGGDPHGELMESGRRVSRELRANERWLSLAFDPITDPSGQLKGAVFILKDVTEVRRAQEAARLMMTAIEQLEEGVLMADPKGRITYFNPAAERITGYSRGEVLGRNTVVPEDRTDSQFREFWETAWSKVERDGIWTGSKTARRKDGTLYEQELVVSAVHGSRGERISSLVIVRDMTERKRLQAIAEAANNMNNIGFIFSGVRHELGNPVNSIKVAASVMRQDFDSMDDSSKREYLERILSDVQRLESLLKVLQSFSMFENLSLGQVELCSFIRDLMPTIEPDFARAGIVISYLFPDGGCRVLADRRALYQIVVNLLINAHGALAGRDHPAIALRVDCGPGGRRLTVEDNGIGMTDEVRGNIFKPFYTTRQGGTGLGMVICQKLVLAMNGYIEVDSTPGRGTKVTVVLPGE